MVLPASKKMKKILFIEDDNILQKAVSEVLEKKGFKVISAFDGISGLKVAKEEKPDLILLDLILPKLDGFGVLKELKETSDTSEIPVLVLTNLEDLESLQKVVEFGVKDYLVKSEYSLEELVKKIEETIK